MWEAGLAFNQKAAVCDTLSLLAACERRPRAAMLLVGYAAADYARGSTTRLDVYRLCAERAAQLAAHHLDASTITALQERGRAWPTGGVAMLAFGTGDVEPAAA